VPPAVAQPAAALPAVVPPAVAQPATALPAVVPPAAGQPAAAQPVPAAEPPLPVRAPSGHRVLVIERILRDRKGLWRQIMEERELGRLIRQLFTSSVVALAFYGAVLGASASFAQAVSSAVKLPVLFLVTLAICLPTLYLFNLVFGARLSLVQAIALVLVAVTVISALSLAFAPVSLFFLVTAPNYAFYKLLNVGILMLTGVVGLTVLLDGMRSLNRQATAGEAPPAPPQMVPGQPFPVRPPAQEEQPVNMGLLRIWVLLFGFVGTQLAWTLRPFVGHPDEDFQILRRIEGNFYLNILETIGSWIS
jgi:hypothetical protein